MKYAAFVFWTLAAVNIGMCIGMWGELTATERSGGRRVTWVLLFLAFVFAFGVEVRWR
jgi:hypothetical protein